MTHGSLFSGIGGFDLAAEWMGWENKFHCEWNEFGQKVLKHYWPDAELFTDITKSNFTKYAGTIDIISGGFPCQPYSAAGKRKGKEDERHLWPEMLRTIREVQPRWVVGENVLGLVNWSGGMVFNEVQADLEAAAYEVWTYVLPAVSVNAPHRRDRVWFVAHAKGIDAVRTGYSGCDSKKSEKGIGSGIFNEFANDGKIQFAADAKLRSDRLPTEGGVDMERTLLERREWGEKADGFNIDNKDATNANCSRERQNNGQGKSKFFNENGKIGDWSNFPTESPICGRNDGIPNRLDGITFSKWRNESIKAYGNAVVPQVVYQIFKAIQEYENLNP